MEFARGVLQALGMSACEDQLRSFSAGTSGRFEPNAGATADHDDGLPEKLGFSLNRRDGACVDYDFISPLSCLTYNDSIRDVVQVGDAVTATRAHPKVKQNASASGSRKLIVKFLSPIGLDCRIS